MLAQKFEQYAPQVIAFNGVGTFENFAQRPCKPGLRKERLYGAQVFVLPSTSAKNATGRGQKLRYFRQLAKLLEKLPSKRPRRCAIEIVGRGTSIAGTFPEIADLVHYACRSLFERGVDGVGGGAGNPRRRTGVRRNAIADDRVCARQAHTRAPRDGTF